MHPHTARFKVPVSGDRGRRGAPHGPKAYRQLRPVIGHRRSGAPIYAIGGGAPIATEAELIDLRKEIKRLDGEAATDRAAADKLVEDIRAAGTDPLKDKDAFEKVDTAYKVGDAKLQQSAELRERAERVMEILGQKPRANGDDRPRHLGGDAPLTARLAERYVESEVYQAARKAGIFTSGGAHVSLDPVEIMTRDELLESLRLRATVSWPAAVPLDQQPGAVEFPVRVIRLLDLITVGETDSDTVEYVEETTRTDAAAETAYGTLAPEATYIYTKKTSNVRRIPHAAPATKGNLADAGQLRTLIGSRLSYGVEKRLEGQLVSGDGAGENLRGIVNTTGINTVALGVDTRLDALHKAITEIRLDEGEPDAIGLEPADYEQTVLAKDSQGQYLLGPAFNQTVRSIWGLPAVVSSVFTTGTVLVGDYRRGATLWVRSGIDVSASDSHLDFFTKGLVMFLAELRAAFAAVQPKFFATVTGY